MQSLRGINDEETSSLNNLLEKNNSDFESEEPIPPLLPTLLLFAFFVLRICLVFIIKNTRKNTMLHAHDSKMTFPISWTVFWAGLSIFDRDWRKLMSPATQYHVRLVFLPQLLMYISILGNRQEIPKSFFYPAFFGCASVVFFVSTSSQHYMFFLGSICLCVFFVANIKGGRGKSIFISLGILAACRLVYVMIVRDEHYGSNEIVCYVQTVIEVVLLFFMKFRAPTLFEFDLLYNAAAAASSVNPQINQLQRQDSASSTVSSVDLSDGGRPLSSIDESQSVTIQNTAPLMELLSKPKGAGHKRHQSSQGSTGWAWGLALEESNSLTNSPIRNGMRLDSDTDDDEEE